MDKKKKIHLSILKNILLTDGYITTNKLSQLIGVSPKTISNYMDQVYQLATEKNLTLSSKKGKGYTIDANFFIKESVALTLKDNDPVPYFKDERKLFLIHKLLTSEEVLRIPYIEYLLHISRPSVYKCLDDIHEWFSKYNIILYRKNYRGVYIAKGEKRHRLATIDWYLETKKFFDCVNSHGNYPDVLKLQKCIKYYDDQFDDDVINDTIYQIQSLVNFKCVKDYIDKLKITLKISLIRIRNGHFITLSDKRKELVQYLDSGDTVSKIIEIIYSNFNISISSEEAIYFFSLVLAGDTSHQKEIINVSDDYINLSNTLFNYLNDYINSNLNIKYSLKEEFLCSIKQYIESELTYQIGYDSKCKLQFSIIKNKYPILYNNAVEISKLIETYTKIQCTDRFISNIVYLLSTIILKSKDKLKTILIHDCNSSEMEFIVYKLNMYLPEVDIISVYEYSDPTFTLDENEFELIITTLDINISSNIKTIIISRPLSHCNIIYYNSIVHEYFEKINQDRILLNKFE